MQEITKTIYRCDFCHSCYDYESDVIQCEKSHRSTEKATYTPIYMAYEEYPQKILLKFPHDRETIEYEIGKRV